MIESPDKSTGIEIDGATVSFGGLKLFDNLSLRLEAGQWTCLLGPSGVGKTTLLRVIAGLVEKQSSATIRSTDGSPLTHQISYMAQQDLLLPWLDALNNALLGGRLRGQGLSRDRAEYLFEAVGLADSMHARPRELSGGMRQRVALVRTLMEDRPIVLMDEPFAALDAITRVRLQNLAADLLRGRTTFLVTHDPLEALRLGDRILVLSGRPATLREIEVPTGATPRDTADPSLLIAQGTLLQELTVADASGDGA